MKIGPYLSQVQLKLLILNVCATFQAVVTGHTDGTVINKTQEFVENHWGLNRIEQDCRKQT